MPTVIRAALSGCPLRLASGVERDWVFVDDVARGCALTLDGRAEGFSVNLASGRLIPNEQVIELVEQASGTADRDRLDIASSAAMGRRAARIDVAPSRCAGQAARTAPAERAFERPVRSL